MKHDSVLFLITGVASGEFLNGVRYLPNQKADTHSVITHSQKLISFLRTINKIPISGRL